MDNKNLTILSVGEIENSKVIEKYGKATAVTDLAILTGGLLSDYFVSDDKTLKGRAGFFWTKTKCDNKDFYEIYGRGTIAHSPKYWTCRSLRPVFASSTIVSNLDPLSTKGYNDIDEVEYGEYPQDAASSRMQKKLESVYTKGMNKTGRRYTFNSIKYNEESEFEALTYDEYEFKGKRYIRVNANTSYGICKVKLSNGQSYKNGEAVWIEISPVKWLIDKEKNLLIAKKGLVSGIRILSKNEGYDDFSKTEVQKFLDTYMTNELVQNPIFVKPHDMTPKEKEQTKEDLEEIKKREKEKILLAKQKLKEAAELFNNLDSKTNFDKIKIDNLRQLIFKNNGKVGENGFIEFDDFFRDNELLRIIDLSDLDLENVDITNMDFSGTNIHIDPQTIYNKDMTGVNALDVHFSPFLDSFDDVILDGTKINDKEAMINLDKVKSYDNNTIIENNSSNITK